MLLAPELLDLGQSEVDGEDPRYVATSLRDVVGLLTVRELLACIGGVLQPGSKG